MGKTDKEVLELCKAWFEDIMERCDRLTSGNVSHGSRAIHGVAKNYAEYVDEHLHNTWKPGDERTQPKQWSKEDEEIFNEIIGDLEALELKTISEKYSAMYKKEIHWLESFKDRMSNVEQLKS